MANTTSPTVAWICADKTQTALANAIDEQVLNSFDSRDIVAICGTATTPLDEAASIRVVTGCVEDGQFPGAGTGDLLIYASSDNNDDDDENQTQGAVVRRAVDILHREIGEDASWLRIGPSGAPESSTADSQRRPKLVYVESREEMDKFAMSGGSKTSE